MEGLIFFIGVAGIFVVPFVLWYGVFGSYIDRKGRETQEREARARAEEQQREARERAEERRRRYGDDDPGEYPEIHY